MQNVYESVESNQRKSALVVLAFIIFITISTGLIAQAFSWYYGYNLSPFGFLGVGLLISGLTSLISYYYSDKIVLKISGARPADRKRDFQFFSVAENLAIAASIPTPKLYVIEDNAMNAFATGRDPKHAVVCATTGLLAKLDRTELEGVVAHEISHITNYDIRLMSIVTVLVGVVTLLGDWLLQGAFWGGGERNRDRNGSAAAISLILGLALAILAPIIAQLIQLAISRSREFLADASAVKLTRQPAGLISALKKLGADKEPLEAANKATAHLYIVNPLRNIHSRIGMFASLFNTHPPLAERIKALEAMA